MNDFENSGVHSGVEPTENDPKTVDSIELPSVDDDKAETDESGEAFGTSEESFGGVYTPTDVRGRSNSYSYTAYSVPQGKKRQDAHSRSGNGRRKRNSGGVPKWIWALCIVLAGCLCFSGCAFVGAGLLANVIDSDDTTDITNNTQAPGDVGNIYVDKTGKDLSDYTVNAEEGDILPLTQAVNMVKDSVVEITTETVTSGFGGFSQYVVSGAGSGVIISDGGYIITNNHVIAGARAITVRLSDGAEFPATLIATDAKTDVAVISINPGEKKLKPAIIGNSDTLVLAEEVFAIGNPLGELGGTVTDGIISCLEREVHIEGSGKMNLLQTNTAVSPGNSGGGLFDMRGRLVGVINAKSSGDGIEGISFAIPINTAWDVACELIEQGYISGRPVLGVKVSEQVYGYGVTGEKYYAVFVSEDSAESGLKSGDRILSIEGYEISSIDDITEIITNYEIGDTVEVVVIRSRRYYTAKIALVEYSPE